MRPAMALIGMVVLAPAAAQAEESLCGPPGPEPVRLMSVSKQAGGVVRLQWIAQWGHYSDAVRGSLSTLAATAGDFAAALDGCILEDLPDTTASSLDDAEVPPPSEGYWYLLRADRYSGCGTGVGTYNWPFSQQVGDRNGEILASGSDCGCSQGDCTVWNP